MFLTTKRTAMASILVVDDDKKVLDVTAEILEYYGYTVYKAINVAHAMAILELNWIDLMILDLSMPRKDGTYLFSFIEEYFPWVDIIVYSGYELKSHPEKKLIRLKTKAFVPKGEGVEILIKKIKKVLK